MEPGQSFDRYVLFDDLKPRSSPRPAASPARTFLALDRESGEVVVVQATAADQDSADLFLENCQRARSADMAGTPTLLAAGYHSGQGFVTHQWMAGVSFREILQVVAPQEELARVLAVEATRCLAQLHGHELVHADLHPENFLLCTDGKLFLVGHMPRPLGRPASTYDDTLEVARYMAPEILDGVPPSSSSDVFSMGLVAFELFAGQRLLRRSSAAELRMDLEILAPSLEVLLAKNAALTPSVRSVLTRCLRVDPSERFKGGADLLEELIGQAPMAQAEPRESFLRGLISQVPPQVTRQIYLRVREGVEDRKLVRVISELWRYASLVPRSDRTRARSGYLATMEALWLCLLHGAGDAQDRVRAGAAAYLLHRLARTWGSRSLRLLATELCYRFTDDGSRLRELLGDPPIPEAKARKLADRFRANLETQPRSEKALLGLTIFTPGLDIQQDETLGALKARVLSRHELYRPALFYRCRDILDQTDATEVLGDVSTLLRQVRAAAGEPVEPLPASDGFDFDAVVAKAHEARRERLESSSERLAESRDVESDTDSSASFDLPTPGTLPDLAALRLAAGLDPDSSAPSLDPASVEPVDSQLSRPMNDARELFEEGQVLAEGGDLAGAAAAFHELLGSGVLQREFYYSRVCTEVRGLLWQFLRRPGTPERAAIHALWALAVEADLTTLLPLSEFLLGEAYASIAHDDAAIAEVERMVALRPGSFLLRQVAAGQALARQENFRWAEHLVAAARDRLEMRDLLNAAKLLMAARSAAVLPELEEAHGRMISLAEQIAEAGGALNELRRRLQNEDAPARAYAAIAELARRFPSHEPTLEELARRARAAGYGSQAGDVLMDLGRARMLRGDHAGARSCFRQVLESELENDEALLYLTSLRSHEGELPEDLDLVRPTILAAEGLYEAGIHRALQALDGTARDVALRELLIEMSLASGRDPSRHRVGLAILALGAGDRDRCRELCDQAFAEAEDPRQLVEILLRVPKIDMVYSRVELAQRRG